MNGLNLMFLVIALFQMMGAIVNYAKGIATVGSACTVMTILSVLNVFHYTNAYSIAMFVVAIITFVYVVTIGRVRY